MREKNNRYLVVLLLQSNIAESKKQHYLDETRKIFSAFGLDITEEKESSITHLSYPIKKCLDGFYHVFAIAFKNPVTTIRQKVLNNVRIQVSKICEGNMLRYMYLNDRIEESSLNLADS